MAKNDKYTIANPTKVTLETADKAVKVLPNQVVVVSADVEAHPQYLAELISKGCVAAPAQVKNSSGEYTGKLFNATELVERGARLLDGMVRAVFSAGADTFAGKGL